MPKKAQDDLIKKTLNLRKGDFEKMGELLAPMLPSEAIRELVSRFVDQQFKNKSAAEESTNEQG